MSELLVEVVKIEKLTKHENADTLQIAQINGWFSIVKEGEFKEGDLAVYIPIDSVIPDSMLEKYDLAYLKNGARVKTVKLRGLISQGLLLPADPGWKIGQDVAQILGIKKWEPAVPFYQSGQKNRKRNPNPNFKVYTDIQDIKNHINVFKEGEPVYISEKIHGTNFRAGSVPIGSKGLVGWLKGVFIGTHEFVVGSHNVQFEGNTIGNWIKKRKTFYGENVYAKIAKRYKLKEILSHGLILYGEIYGLGIQSLEYGMPGIDVAFFDMTVDGKYVSYEVLREFCNKHKLPMVPKLYVGEFSQRELDYCTNGNSMIWPNHIREGCVVKPLEESNHPQIGRKVLKSISDEYLLKKDRTDFH